jgi:hypothetical protein
MQGIYLSGLRPKSKKEIKLALEEHPESVALESTSLFGDEYGGPITGAPDGEYYFVGPDPYRKRTFYGKITKRGATLRMK